ncbi:hypothetical protein I315_05758 [Cryptococcus gattii Ru294]|nr:hypothetical protein I315_05758 [Cryptococcus gattii Ru294]
MSVLKEVGRKGLSEGKLTREWEDQKKTQEDEGQIEASVERRRKYEKLGELLSLWDRVKGIRRVLMVPAYQSWGGAREGLYLVSQRKRLGCFQGHGLPSEEAFGRASSAGVEERRQLEQ